LLGSVLFTGLVWNHPFHNANKRTAFAACRLFLLLNGARFDPPEDELVDVARELAQRMYDEAQIASWISWYTRPVDCTEYLHAIDDTISATGKISSEPDDREPDPEGAPRT